MFSFIIRRCGAIHLYGLIVASLLIKQICKIIRKTKIKPYLHQDHAIGQVFLFVDCFHSQKQPKAPSHCHILYFDLF